MLLNITASKTLECGDEFKMKGKLLTALYLASCVASVNVYATDTNPSWYVLPQVGNGLMKPQWAYLPRSKWASK